MIYTQYGCSITEITHRAGNQVYVGRLAEGAQLMRYWTAVDSLKADGGIHEIMAAAAGAIDVSTPDLTGRRARCAYFGIVVTSRYDCHGRNCNCIVPSTKSLAFFEYRPVDEYDSYYCGCRGFD